MTMGGRKIDCSGCHDRPTLLRGGGTVRASFSLLRSAKKRQKSPLKESVSANFVPD